MSSRIIIDGNAIYEVDEECLRKKKKKEKEQEEEHEKQQEKRKNKTQKGRVKKRKFFHASFFL